MTTMTLVQSVRSAATSVPEGCPGTPEEEHHRGAHRLDQGESRRVDNCVRRTHTRIKCKFKKTISTKINNKADSPKYHEPFQKPQTIV